VTLNHPGSPAAIEISLWDGDPGYQVPLGALRALSATRFRDDGIPETTSPRNHVIPEFSVTTSAASIVTLNHPGSPANYRDLKRTSQQKSIIITWIFFFVIFKK